MHASGHAAIFIQAITGLKARLIGFVLVDDTDLFVMARHPEEPALGSAAACAQAGGLAWHRPLGTSGSALEPDKCCCTLIDFIWVNGTWLCKASQEAPALTLMPTKRATATKAAGAHQAADGNMRTQVGTLAEKVTEMGAGIWGNWVPRRAVWCSLKAVIWLPTRCPLPACSLSKLQASMLATSLCKALLPSQAWHHVILPQSAQAHATALPRPCSPRALS